MSKYRILLWLQIKSAFKSLPKLICATLVFAALTALVGIGGTELLKKDNNDSKLEIALVLPTDSDLYTKMAFSFISEIETVSNVCTFNEMSEEAAFKGLRDGSIYAIIQIPDKFIEHIMNGTNTPAKIILPQSDLTSESMFFRRLVNAGVDDLGAAQAGIYAVDDVCRYYRIVDGVEKSEKFLNSSYLSYALKRDTYFKTETVSSTGALTSAQFYLCTGVVLLLLLSGISCMDLLKHESSALSQALIRRRIPAFILDFFKLTGVTIVFYIMIISAYFMVSLAKIRFPEIMYLIPDLHIISILCLALLLFSVFSLVIFIFHFARTQSAGVLILFTVSALMLFVSGGFIPSALLPKLLQQISVFLPVTYYLRLCAEIITNTLTFSSFIINILFSVFFITATAFSDRLQRNQI